MSVSCEATSESHRIMLKLHGIMPILCVVMLNCHADMLIFHDVASKIHPIMLKLHFIMSTRRVVKLSCYADMFKRQLVMFIFFVMLPRKVTYHVENVCRYVNTSCCQVKLLYDHVQTST